MPLTPADVHNVAFSKPPIGKRGYNEDEVDAFLDLVENELSRLIEENTDLRQRVAELDQELASARAGGGAAQPTQTLPVYEPEPEPAPAPAPQPVYEAPPAQQQPAQAGPGGLLAYCTDSPRQARSVASNSGTTMRLASSLTQIANTAQRKSPHSRASEGCRWGINLMATAP